MLKPGLFAVPQRGTGAQDSIPSANWRYSLPRGILGESPQLLGGVVLRPLMLAVVLACPSVLWAQFKTGGDSKHPRTLTVSNPLPPDQTLAQLSSVLVAREYTIRPCGWYRRRLRAMAYKNAITRRARKVSTADSESGTTWPTR